MNSRPGIAYIAAVPDDEVITSMITHNDNVYVSTDRRVYLLIQYENGNHRLKPIVFDPTDI